MKLQDYKAQYDALKVKKNLITESEQLAAVKQDVYALRYVPATFFEQLPTEMTIQ